MDNFDNNRGYSDSGWDESGIHVVFADQLNTTFKNVSTPPPSINLNDPDSVFAAFDKAFEATGCKISTESQPKSGYGGYQAFLTFPKEGGQTYLNTIFLNNERDPHKNRVSETHEKFHAVQFDTIPELHASPYNMLAYQEVPILLSPRSWVQAMLLIEREAYAKTAWINRLALDKNYCPDYEGAADTEIVNTKDVAHWHGRFPDDVAFALGEASLVWDDKITEKLFDSIPLPISPDLTKDNGSRLAAVYISGLPDNAILSEGKKQEDGRWSVKGSKLAGLTLKPALGWNGALSLDMTTIDTDGLSSSTTLDVVVPKQPDVKLRDHYINFAISLYEESYRLHKSKTAAAPIFVDLDDAGILSLGSSFGPSIFGKSAPDPIFKNLVLTPEQEGRIQALEQKFRIDPTQKLPTLDETLSDMGMTREQYMQRSKRFYDVGLAPDPQNDMGVAL